MSFQRACTVFKIPPPKRRWAHGLVFRQYEFSPAPQLGRDSIYQLLRNGEILSQIVGGKRLVTRVALQKWIDSITNGIDLDEA